MDQLPREQLCEILVDLPSPTKIMQQVTASTNLHKHEFIFLFPLIVFDRLVEFDDVGATIQSLKDLDLTILLLDSHGLEDFDDTLLIVCKIGTLEHFRVLATAELMIGIVIVELTPVQI